MSIGVDTDPNARRVAHALLEAYDAGLGRGEGAMFPNIIMKVAKGINFEPGTPNHDILRHSLSVSSRRMNPTYALMNCAGNEEFGLEASYMGCRSRVLANINGPSISAGRGNIAFTSLNLPLLALDSLTNKKPFLTSLNELLDLAEESLLFRYDVLKNLRQKDIPMVFDGLYVGSENIEPGGPIEPALKNGSLSYGVVGLADCLRVLTGHHHGESEEAQKLGLEIVKAIRDHADAATQRNHLNFSVIGSPAEGTCDRFCRCIVKEYGEIKDVTTKGYITNSTHVPVEYEIPVSKKFEIEGPYHRLTNAGHIAYSEFKEAPVDNIDGLYEILKLAVAKDIGYFGFNYPIDRCISCGNNGLIPDDCFKCGSTDIRRVRRVSGYFSTLDKMNDGKLAETLARESHYNLKKG